MDCQLCSPSDFLRNPHGCTFRDQRFTPSDPLRSAKPYSRIHPETHSQSIRQPSPPDNFALASDTQNQQFLKYSLCKSISNTPTSWVMTRPLAQAGFRRPFRTNLRVSFPPLCIFAIVSDQRERTTKRRAVARMRAGFTRIRKKMVRTNYR